MNTLRFRKLFFLALASSTVLACNALAVATPQPVNTLNGLYTSAVQTLNAMSTQGAATPTPQPSPTGTLQIIPTASAFKTFTPVPPIQPTAKCDAADFITDVSYPDGSSVGFGVTFTKIWRIKNVGTCPWTTAYALVYVSGEKFGTQNAVAMPGRVEPGQTVDLPIQLTAPKQIGRFKGYWMLRNASNVLFGVGNDNSVSIYVDVNTSGYTILGYDFLEKACEASWNTDSQNLPCPGTNADSKGFVMVLNSPKLENGTTQNKGLITHPQMVKDGMITGKYPAFTVQSGDRFEAWINCLYNANDCDMLIKVQYQIGNNAIQTLGQWHEVYEGQYYPINIDLNALAGQKVKFIFTVLANGSPHEDYALWIAPRITRLSPQPPTTTFTPSRTPTTTVTATSTFTATVTSTFTATATATDTPTATP